MGVGVIADDTNHGTIVYASVEEPPFLAMISSARNMVEGNTCKLSGTLGSEELGKVRISGEILLG